MTPPATAERRQWVGLALLVLPCLLISLDMTVLVYAVPSLSTQLAPSGTELLWIMDIYSFMMAGTLVTMGTLGDRIGRRRLLMIGAAAFGAASILCAFSPTPAVLIAARALLGLAAATIDPSTLSLIRSMFTDERERRTAVSIWSASLAGGALLGPLVGGALLDHFWWGSVFLINVPFMIVLLLLGPRLLPERRDPVGARLDLVSTVLSLAAVLPVVSGVKMLAQDGPSAASIGALVVGAVVGVVFWRRQRAQANPLLDVRLLGVPGLGPALLTGAVALFAITGVGIATAQYMQLVLGLDPFTAGLWSLPPVLVMIVSSTVAPALAARVRPATLIGIGLTLGAGGLLAMGWVGFAPAIGLAVVVVGNTVMQAGLGLVLTLVSDLVISVAPPERAGTASGLSQTAQELGGALGIAVLGSVLTATFQAHVPAGYPDEARQTLAGALAEAARLPGEAGAALAALARTAFGDGLVTASLVAGTVMAVAAVGTAVLLHRARPATDARVGAESANR
jgi:MFS transporter, DHA2 family, multidrug resistance protein